MNENEASQNGLTTRCDLNGMTEYGLARNSRNIPSANYSFFAALQVKRTDATGRIPDKPLAHMQRGTVDWL